jgi:hypothetical protein
MKNEMTGRTVRLNLFYQLVESGADCGAEPACFVEGV